MGNRERIDKLKQRISELELRNSLFLEHRWVFFFLADTETLKFVEFNRVAHEILGYTREEFEALTLPDILAISEQSVYVEQVEKGVGSGEHTFESAIRHKDGASRNFMMSIRTVCILGRQYIHAIGLDITEQKNVEMKLKESDARYSAICDLIPNGIAILEKGTILFTNRAYAHMLGYKSAEEIMGRPIWEIAPFLNCSDNRKSSLDLCLQTNTPAGYVIDQAVKGCDGQIIYLEIFCRIPLRC